MRGFDIRAFSRKNSQRRQRRRGDFRLMTGRACCRNAQARATVLLYYDNCPLVLMFAQSAAPSLAANRRHPSICRYFLQPGTAGRLNEFLSMMWACELALLILCKV